VRAQRRPYSCLETGEKIVGKDWTASISEEGGGEHLVKRNVFSGGSGDVKIDLGERLEIRLKERLKEAVLKEPAYP